MIIDNTDDDNDTNDLISSIGYPNCYNIVVMIMILNLTIVITDV